MPHQKMECPSAAVTSCTGNNTGATMQVCSRRRWPPCLCCFHSSYLQSLSPSLWALARHAGGCYTTHTYRYLSDRAHIHTHLHVLVCLWPCVALGANLHHAAVLPHEESPVEAVAMQPHQHICLADIQQVRQQVPAGERHTGHSTHTYTQNTHVDTRTCAYISKRTYPPQGVLRRAACA